MGDHFDSDDDPRLENDCNSWDIQPLAVLPQQPQELHELFHGQVDHLLASVMGSPTLGPIDASIFNESYFVDAISQTPAQTTHNSSYDCQVRLERENDGRCADCGAQTHEVKLDTSGKTCLMTKVPLTVPGEVHRGRCLFCHPLPASFIQRNSSGGIDINRDMPPPQSASEATQQQFKPQTTAPHRRRSTTSHADGQPYPMAFNRPLASQKRSSMSQDLPLSFLQEMSPSPGGGDRTAASFSDRLNSLYAYRNLQTSISSSNSDTASSSFASSQNLASPGIWSYKLAPVWTEGQHLPFIKKDIKSDDFAEQFQHQQLLIEQMQSQLNRFTEAAEASEESRVGDSGSLKSHQSHKTHPSLPSQQSSQIYPQLFSTLPPLVVKNIESDIAVVSQHSSCLTSGWNEWQQRLGSEKD